MKKLLFVLSPLLLASCMELSFPQPMPASGMVESAFPEQMLGTYVSHDDNDTLVLDAHSYRGKDQLFYSMGDSLVVKKDGKYYVINFLNERGWQLVLARVKGDDRFDLYGFDVSNEKNVERLEKILPVERIESGLKSYYLVKPTDEQFEKMIHSRNLVRYGKFRKIETKS